MRAIRSTSDNKDNTSDNNLCARLVARQFRLQRAAPPPRTRTLEQARVDGRLAEKRVEPLARDAFHAVRDAGDEPAGHAHHANARLAGGGVRVRDGGDGANLVVRRFGEGQGRMRMSEPLPLSRSPERPRPVARMLPQFASAMEVSSLQVPGGWL